MDLNRQAYPDVAAIEEEMNSERAEELSETASVSASAGVEAATSAAIAACHQGTGASDLSEVVEISQDTSVSLLAQQLTDLREEIADLHQDDLVHLSQVHERVETAVSELEQRLAILMCRYAHIACTNTSVSEVASVHGATEDVRAVGERAEAAVSSGEVSLPNAIDLLGTTSHVFDAMEESAKSAKGIAVTLEGASSHTEAINAVGQLSSIGVGFTKSVTTAKKLLDLSSILRDDLNQIREDKESVARLRQALADADAEHAKSGCSPLSARDRSAIDSEIKVLVSSIREKRLDIAQKIYQILALIIDLIAHFMQMIEALIKLLSAK